MIDVDAGSVKMTILGLRNVAVAERTAARNCVNAAGGVALHRIRQRMSNRDYTQADLDALDHPYAKRHGTIRIHRNTLGGTKVVHTQTGVLLSNVRGKSITTSSGFGYEVRATGDRARYVIQGTAVMLPRDVLRGTINEPRVKKEMMRAMLHQLGPVLRSQAAVRFRKG